MTSKNSNGAVVHVVDDDRSIRHAMELLLKSVGHRYRIFESGADFLAHFTLECRGCLVLDIRMPGIGGLDLQAQLREMGSTLPVIFVTGFGDVPMAVDAMQNGAFDFLEKPFRDQDLLDRVAAALDADSAQRQQAEVAGDIARRAARLTKREREVYDLVVTGKPNKVIAHELGVSQRTVEIHRARVMEKMEARSLAELVRMHLAG